MVNIMVKSIILIPQLSYLTNVEVCDGKLLMMIKIMALGFSFFMVLIISAIVSFFEFSMNSK